MDLSKLPSVVAIALIAGTACAKSPPPTIDELRNTSFAATFEHVGNMPDGDGFSAAVVAYRSGGLLQHAIVAKPDQPKPDGGYPVLVFNHGHHPEPQKNGFTADGRNLRPGDYYRPVFEAFVREGFMVVAPDYRGHNISEGLEYTEGMLEASYYTEDVLNLLAALPGIDDADAGNVFMWGHSMGGEVTLRTLLVAGGIRGASLWSPVGGDIWDQAYYYSRYEDPDADDTSDADKAVVTLLRKHISELDGPYDTRDNEPLLQLEHLGTPLIIHHAIDDRGAAFKWSLRLAKELYLLGHPYVFHSYAGDAHLFGDDVLRQAVARDVAFFRGLAD